MAYFLKVKDADNILMKHNEMLTASMGQNKVNSSFRVSQEDAHKDMFRRMMRWTMTFWALAPRTVTKYISFENEGRDSCKQTILPSELIFKFCESRNKFISWDTPHIRTDSVLKVYLKPNWSSDVILYASRHRGIVLWAWNYPGVQNFSCTDPLFRNSDSFTIPLVSIPSLVQHAQVFYLLHDQADMKGNLPFQVCVFDIYLFCVPLF